MPCFEGLSTTAHHENPTSHPQCHQLVASVKTVELTGWTRIQGHCYRYPFERERTDFKMELHIYDLLRSCWQAAQSFGLYTWHLHHQFKFERLLDMSIHGLLESARNWMFVGFLAKTRPRYIQMRWGFRVLWIPQTQAKGEGLGNIPASFRSWIFQLIGWSDCSTLREALLACQRFPQAAW